MSPHRIAWIVTIPLTLAWAVLAGLNLTHGGVSITIAVGALMVLASHLAMRFLHAHSPLAAWSVVWLAVATCFATVFRVEPSRGASLTPPGPHCENSWRWSHRVAETGRHDRRCPA